MAVELRKAMRLTTPKMIGAWLLIIPFKTFLDCHLLA